MDGVIDHLGRSVIWLQTPSPNSENFLCLIDTGFNRYLFLEQSVARRLGFRPETRRLDQIIGRWQREDG